MKYLNKVRENCLLFLLGVRLSTASKVELFMAAQADYCCGGSCICISAALPPNGLDVLTEPVTLSEAQCGICPGSTIPATNTKC